MRGTLFWGPYDKDPTIAGTPPIFGNSHILLDRWGPSPLYHAWFRVQVGADPPDQTWIERPEALNRIP